MMEAMKEHNPEMAVMMEKMMDAMPEGMPMGPMMGPPSPEMMESMREHNPEMAGMMERMMDTMPEGMPMGPAPPGFMPSPEMMAAMGPPPEMGPRDMGAIDGMIDGALGAFDKPPDFIMFGPPQTDTAGDHGPMPFERMSPEEMRGGGGPHGPGQEGMDGPPMVFQADPAQMMQFFAIGGGKQSYWHRSAVDK